MGAKGQTANSQEADYQGLTACRPWLDADIEALKPEAIVCLGATAAQALMGKSFRVTQSRGELIPSTNGRIMLGNSASLLHTPCQG
jgi:uracil-DNA glycosylase family 4